MDYTGTGRREEVAEPPEAAADSVVACRDASGLLAVDIGSRSAFCYGHPGARLIWGSIRIAKKDSPLGEAGLSFFRWFNNLIGLYHPSWFFCEPPFFQYPGAAAKLMGWHMMAHTICRRHGVAVPPDGRISSTKVAKFIHGGSALPKGKKKQLTQLVLIERYGLGPFLCEDESDAVAVLLFGEALVSPEDSRKRGIGSLFSASAQAGIPARARFRRSPALDAGN